MTAQGCEAGGRLREVDGLSGPGAYHRPRQTPPGGEDARAYVLTANARVPSAGTSRALVLYTCCTRCSPSLHPSVPFLLLPSLALVFWSFYRL